MPLLTLTLSGATNLRTSSEMRPLPFGDRESDSPKGLESAVSTTSDEDIVRQELKMVVKENCLTPSPPPPPTPRSSSSEDCSSSSSSFVKNTQRESSSSSLESTLQGTFGFAVQAVPIIMFPPPALGHLPLVPPLVKERSRGSGGGKKGSKFTLSPQEPAQVKANTMMPPPAAYLQHRVTQGHSVSEMRSPGDDIDPAAVPRVQSLSHVQSLEKVLYDQGCYETEQGLELRREVLRELNVLVQQWMQSVSLSMGMHWQDIDKIGGRIVTYGSYMLGICHQGADIDAICIAPRHISREECFDSFKALLSYQNEVTELRAIEETYVPVLKMKYNGVEVDMTFARLNTPHVPPESSEFACNSLISSLQELSQLDSKCVRSLNGLRSTMELKRLVPNKDVFRLALRAVKLWAKSKGLYSNKLGYPGGFSWAVLVAKVCMMYPQFDAVEILQKFFRTYAEWPWPVPVTLTALQKVASPLISPSASADASGLSAHSPSQFSILGLNSLSQVSWNPDRNVLERYHAMPIITPTFPHINSTFNVTAGTKKLIQQKMLVAAGICDKISQGKQDWAQLFENCHIFHEYEHFLVVIASAYKYLLWFGLIESKIRNMVNSIEKDYGSIVSSARIWPKPFKKTKIADANLTSTKQLWFIGLEFSGPIHRDYKRSVSTFREMLLHQARAFHTPDMGIECHFVLKSELRSLFSEEEIEEIVSSQSQKDVAVMSEELSFSANGTLFDGKHVAAAAAGEVAPPSLTSTPITVAEVVSSRPSALAPKPFEPAPSFQSPHVIPLPNGGLPSYAKVTTKSLRTGYVSTDPSKSNVNSLAPFTNAEGRLPFPKLPNVPSLGPVPTNLPPMTSRHCYTSPTNVFQSGGGSGNNNGSGTLAMCNSSCASYPYNPIHSPVARPRDHISHQQSARAPPIMERTWVTASQSGGGSSRKSTGRHNRRQQRDSSPSSANSSGGTSGSSRGGRDNVLSTMEKEPAQDPVASRKQATSVKCGRTVDSDVSPTDGFKSPVVREVASEEATNCRASNCSGSSPSSGASDEASYGSLESDNGRSVSFSSDKFPPPALVHARLHHADNVQIGPFSLAPPPPPSSSCTTSVALVDACVSSHAQGVVGPQGQGLPKASEPDSTSQHRLSSSEICDVPTPAPIHAVQFQPVRFNFNSASLQHLQSASDSVFY